MARKQAKIEKEPSSKVERLGFRIDGYTKELLREAQAVEVEQANSRVLR